MDRIKSLFRKNPKLMAGLVVLLALSLPFVINQVLKEQDIRQGAQSVPSVNFNFSPATKTNIKVGESFEVKLIMNAGAHDIGSLGYVLKFDPQKLQMTEGSADTALKSISKKTDGGNFTITYINPLATTVTGNNLTVQNFTFKALSQGEATVSLNEIKVTGKSVGSFVPVENASGITAKYTIAQTTSRNCSSDTNKDNECTCTEHAQCTSGFCGPKSGGSNGEKVCGQDPNYDSSLTAPTNLQPNGNIEAGSKTLTWTASPKSTGGYYIRITDKTENKLWSEDCDNQEDTTNLPTTGGVCRKITSGTSYSYTFEPGHQYEWWVHTRASDGKYGPSANVNVTAQEATAPDVCTANNNRPENCACTEATQCLSNTCTNDKCVPPPQEDVPEGTTGLKLSVKIPGIGEKTATIDDNPQPKNSSRIAKVKILDSANTPITFGQNNNDTTETALLFNTSTYRFEGAVDLGTTIESGNYLVKLSVNNSLYKQIPGIVSITKGKPDNTTTDITLVTGDLDQNNSLGVSDWTNMIACNENMPACTADIRALADLNDNGEIDALDVQILQVGFGTREGD